MLNNDNLDLDTKLRRLSDQYITGTSVVSVTTEAALEKVGELMPMWPEAVAAMPTEMTRVALFSLVRRGFRRHMEWEKLNSRSDIEARYFGKQLDQETDCDIWLCCLRLGRGLAMGQRIYIDRPSFLQLLKRTDTGPNRAWLESGLDRLSGASLKVITRRSGKTVKATCGLLKWGVEEETGSMYIRLDPDGAALFQNLSYLNWETRLGLSSSLSKALQIYVCGHTTGQAHYQPIKNIMEWMGYQGRLRKFRDGLRAGLVDLERAGVIKNWKISPGKQRKDGEIVSWIRP